MDGGILRRLMMRTDKDKNGENTALDFDLAKLFRGEIGPYVADELAAK